MKRQIILLIALAAAAAAFATAIYAYGIPKGMPFAEQASPVALNPNETVASFDGGPLVPMRQSPRIDYNLDPAAEKFFMRMPKYRTGATYGLIVFVSPGDAVYGAPQGWGDVLDRRQLIFIAPFGAGNETKMPRRYGLAVLAALEMMRFYPIDPSRVYVSGLSGGARTAGSLGFYQPDLFRGTIQNCGADFYTAVPRVLATSDTDAAGNPYGVIDATPDEIGQAHAVRFALITGSGDFRHGNILDIYNGGYAKTTIPVKLFDIPGMGHTTADGAVFDAALGFVEGSGI